MVGLPDRCRANRTLPAIRQQAQGVLRLLHDFRAHGIWVGAQVGTDRVNGVAHDHLGLGAGPVQQPAVALHFFDLIWHADHDARPRCSTHAFMTLFDWLVRCHPLHWVHW